MPNISRPLRRRAALAVLALLLTVAAACGSTGDDDASADPGATVAGDTADGTTADTEPADAGDGDEPGSVDPCQWYTAEEMSELLGITVTMEALDTPQALGSECLYDSQADYTAVTVRPSTGLMYDQLKAAAAAAGIGGEQIDFPGVGDEAYHDGSPDKPNPSVAFHAKKGDAAVDVELATSGDAIGSVDRAIEITSAVAAKALG